MNFSNLGEDSSKAMTSKMEIPSIVEDPAQNSRKYRILKRVQDKSEELAKLADEATVFAKKASKKDQIKLKIDKFESEIASEKASVVNKENLDGNFAIPTLLDRTKSKTIITQKAVKLTFKSELEEMQENQKYLKKVLEYQTNFYEQVQTEIESLAAEIQSKKDSIEENNKKINNMLVEDEQMKQEYNQQMQQLLDEEKMILEGIENSKEEIRLEDENYEKLVIELIEAQDKLNKSIGEENQIKADIQTLLQKLEESKNYKNQICQILDGYEKCQADLEKDLNEVLMQKKTLNNELQVITHEVIDLKQLKGNIRVYCRIRPFLDSDPKEDKPTHPFSIRNSNSLDLYVPSLFLKSDNNVKEYKFNFEHIFDEKSSQSELFSELAQLIQSALDGYSVCIFAYGQTGSGKTYTMEGDFKDPERLGVIPRSVALIFSQLAYLKNFGWEYKINVSFQEIYNDTVRDLLTGVSETKADITQVDVSSEEEVYPLLKKASTNRAVAETECNGHSSRSHSIFQLRLTGKNSQTNQTSNGTLNLIDLAGSERLAISKAEGERLKETQAINKSLTSLGAVITAIENNEKHIPYRNSKLTFVLQPYLGGESKTLMLVNISPLLSNFHQTLCALRFAQQVKSCNVGIAKKK